MIDPYEELCALVEGGHLSESDRVAALGHLIQADALGTLAQATRDLVTVLNITPNDARAQGLEAIASAIENKGA